MKKIVLLGMALVLMCFIGCSNEGDSKEDIVKGFYTKEEMTTKLLGTWANHEFMTNLESTKSPYKSFCDVPWLDIRMENNEIMFDEYLNFHEGGTGGIITDIGFSEDQACYYIEIENYFEGSLLDFQRSAIIEEITSESITIIYKDQQNQTKHSFSKIINSPELYANQVVLAGVYKDGKGEKYTFTREGEAIWPTESFNYQLQLDFIGPPTFINQDGTYYNADYFMEKDENGFVSDFVYYYESKGDQLTIYKAYEKEDLYLYEIKELPDLVLTKEEGV